MISCELMNATILKGTGKMRVDHGTVLWDPVADRQFTNIGMALYGRGHLPLAYSISFGDVW
jgi:hypothetical protein